MSLDHIYLNLADFFRLGAALFDGLPHPTFVYAATLPFLLVGVLRNGRADEHILLYTCFMFLFYLFSPAGGLGYWIPLAPFYVYFALAGLQWSAEALEKRWARAGRYLAPALLALVLAYFFGVSRDQALANIYAQRKVLSGPFADASQDIFSFVREKTPPNAVVVFFNPEVMRLFTDRRSIRFDGTSDLSRGNYLCVYSRKKDGDGQIPETAVAELLKRDKLRLMYANSEFRLYEIL
jgi:hypothetical protein